LSYKLIGHAYQEFSIRKWMALISWTEVIVTGGVSMLRKSRCFSVVGLLVVAAIMLVGCAKVSGGGWFIGRHGPDKVTFAFHGTCDTATQTAKGKLEYHDRAANVDLHGDVELPFQVCTGTPIETVVSYLGTYTPQPAKLGPGGQFAIAVNDLGEPGPSNGDGIVITLLSGVYAGHSNSGIIQGGNIQTH
jgi:hypothetical protein